jgi:hypothetical protein
MSGKENSKPKEQETPPANTLPKKHQGRYTSQKNEKTTAKLNETETGPRQSRGKKQRRQFKLAPNRG